jgi:hypothetical protein
MVYQTYAFVSELITKQSDVPASHQNVQVTLSDRTPT